MNELMAKLFACIPRRISDEIGTLDIPFSELYEIRLRIDRPASLTVSGANIKLSSRITRGELSDCISKLCKGSVYAHSETISEGYISYDGGVRIGVCGSCSSEGNVGAISSLNIRIPHILSGVAEPIIKSCLSDGSPVSMLIYSLPGVGKTTLLRDIAAKLGGELQRRTAIIDTRGELYLPELLSDTLCDILLGYPKARGIETATRTLSPEVIICDELGGIDEARAILSAQNSGVPLIASAHAADISQLLSRPSIRLLHDEGVFSYYIGVSRKRIGDKLSRCFSFGITAASEVKR